MINQIVAGAIVPNDLPPVRKLAPELGEDYYDMQDQAQSHMQHKRKLNLKKLVSTSQHEIIYKQSEGSMIYRDERTMRALHDKKGSTIVPKDSDR